MNRDNLVTHSLLVIILLYISDYELLWQVAAWVLFAALVISWLLSLCEWWLKRKLKRLRNL